MSAKKAANNKRLLHMLDNRLRTLLSVVVVIVLCVTVLILLLPDRDASSDISTETAQSTSGETDDALPETRNDSDETTSETAQADTSRDDTTEAVPDDTQPAPSAALGLTLPLDLGRGLKLTRINSYTGLYMEDGSNEIISGVTMIKVENTGDEYIQYAEIALESDAGTANFVLSTLFPGQSIVVLEKDRKTYDSGAEYSGASAGNVAVFSSVPSLCEDKLEIQALDGVINVTNISGGDIAGDVVIYYKNSRGDLLYGGITYRIRITGGIKNGEIRQIVADHFSASGSTIMFITCE